MEIDSGNGPVFAGAEALHATADDLQLRHLGQPRRHRALPAGNKTGVLVTGKPTKTNLPPPFNQVPGVGVGHQVHHKFVVCGFNGDDPVVYCGSSNLAPGGEESNGDNLLAMHDEDVATVFAIEALALVDHFDFLDSVQAGPEDEENQKQPAGSSQPQAAIDAGWFLSTTDRWTGKYYDANDLKNADRQLFA